MRSPLIAAKISPFATLRLSIETPVSGMDTEPRKLPPVMAMSSSIVHSARSAMIVPAGNRRFHRIMIAEWQDRRSDGLPGFMALAGDEEDVSRFQSIDRRPDGECAIADIDAARTCRHHRGADRRRILRTRIVIGHIRDIGELCDDGAHERTLALVAIAAAAENHRELARRIG